MTYNIVTSVAVDPDNRGSDIHYWSLGTVSPKARRDIYWRCAAVCCWVSRSVNADRRHIVYTNDSTAPIVDGFSIERFFERMGVELVRLPFVSDPREHSTSFRNAFYKLDVLRAVADLPDPSIVLDSDVVWRQRSAELDQLICGGDKLLLQDTYQRSGSPDDPEPHGLSMRAMGEAYRAIDPAYDVADPVWWGGELVAGGPALLSRIADGLDRAFPRFIDAAPHVKFVNGSGILDGDEFVSNFVYNRLDVEIVDTYRRFSRRIGTLPGRVDAMQVDHDIPIWHMLNEKRRGFEILFREVRKHPIPFDEWSTRSRPLGNYFGIPRQGERRAWPHRVWRPRDFWLELHSRWNVRRDHGWNPN